MQAAALPASAVRPDDRSEHALRTRPGWAERRRAASRMSHLALVGRAAGGGTRRFVAALRRGTAPSPLMVLVSSGKPVTGEDGGDCHTGAHPWQEPREPLACLGARDTARALAAVRDLPGHARARGSAGSGGSAGSAAPGGSAGSGSCAEGPFAAPTRSWSGTPLGERGEEGSGCVGSARQRIPTGAGRLLPTVRC